MKKKIVTMAMCLALAAATVTACGKDEKTEETKTNTATKNEATADTATEATQITADEAVISIADYTVCQFAPFSEDVQHAYAENYYANQVLKYTLYGMTGYEVDESKADSAVASGDTINIDFVGKMDGTEFEGGSGTDYNLTIGSGTFIDGFEDQLIGAKVGDTVTVNVTFPEDYGQADLAGKAAEFTVTINHFSTSVELTVDNGWYYIYGAADYETCINDLMAGDAAYTEESYETDCREKYVDSVIEGTEFIDLTAEIDKIYASIYSVYETYAANYGLSVDEFATTYGGYDGEAGFEEYYRASAEKQLKGELAFEYILEKEGMEVTDDEYEAYALDIATAAGYETVAEYEAGYDGQFGSGAFKRYIKSVIAQQEVFDKYISYTEEAATTE